VLLRNMGGEGKGYDDTPNQWRGDFMTEGDRQLVRKIHGVSKGRNEKKRAIYRSVHSERSQEKKSQIDTSMHPLSYAALHDPCPEEVPRR
jgi:hypothetical protein